MADVAAGGIAMLMLVFILTAFIWAILCAVVASAKEQGGFGWFILGLLFGPLALIAAAGMPDRTVQNYIIRQRQKKQPPPL